MIRVIVIVDICRKIVKKNGYCQFGLIVIKMTRLAVAILRCYCERLIVHYKPYSK